MTYSYIHVHIQWGRGVSIVFDLSVLKTKVSGDSHGIVVPPPTRLAGVDCET